jgi:hypothetical protein
LGKKDREKRKERTMEKRQLKTKPSTRSRTLCTETLRRLESSEFQGVAGGGRIRIPVGFAEDTTPIYSHEDQL